MCVIITLADRLEGINIGPKSFKILAQEAAGFVSQAHEMEDQGDFQRAVDYCEAASKDLSLAYKVAQEFGERRMFCVPLDAIEFTKHVFAAKLYDGNKSYQHVLEEARAARDAYEKIKGHRELLHSSFERYLVELENLEGTAKFHLAA